MAKTHLEFKEHPIPESRKTKIFHVYSNHDGSELGEIRWESKWRCYVFYPFTGVIWSWGCLKELTEFIKNLMDIRKVKE